MQQENPFPKWSTEMPAPKQDAFEHTMLSHDKLFVVLAVVLIIWFGIVALILNTDRKLARLERKVAAGIPDSTTA